MNDYKFNLTVKPYVERVLVQNPNTGDVVCEMVSVNNIDNGGKIFNGTIPNTEIQKNKDGEFVLRLLGDEGILELSIKNLLSIPISEMVYLPEQSNFIVINDDPECSAMACFVEFSSRFISNMNVPKEIELIRKKTGQLKEEWNAKNSDLIARGVDPKVQNFISSLNLYASDGFVLDILDDLNSELAIIKIYGIDIKKNFIIAADNI